MTDIVEREGRILSYWKEKGINDKVRAKNRGGKKFYFLDGPPYVTGDLHPGQMWVKTVKDVFLRYKRYRGFNVRDRAGYDVHGLPIENKVEKLLNVSSKKDIESTIGIEEFVRKCREYVDSFMGRMDKDYERFGMSLDFSNPYLAYRNEFIETGWGMLKKMDQRGMLYKGKKTTAFCTHCETALAQGSMEVAYSDTEDPSIYVAFKVDGKRSRSKIETTDNTYLLIWTTTPWTLPANVAVAANPKAEYVLVQSDGMDLIVAKARLDAVVGEIGRNVIVRSEFYGSEMEGMMYVNPLEEKVPMQKELRTSHSVVLSEELVSMTDGTGLVHIAPGHGLDDYSLGIKKGLPIFSPVASNGTYTEEAGTYAGLAVPKEANNTVLRDLASMGALLGRGTVRHSYPQCWRCDTKLIYIATEQWFLDIQKVKGELERENLSVVWHPPEAKAWLGDVIGASPDWCISRQRYWGIPLPIWRCKNCGERTLIGSVAELRERELGEKVPLDDLHRPYIDKVVLKCGNCGGGMKRLPDVLDVWFDASIAFRASMTEKEFGEMFPVDYILEGKDQLRGWFSYLLKTSVMAYGSKPYLNVGVDGMLLDEHGREMHKKLGNYVALGEIASSPGADVFRLWCSDHTPWLDLNWNREELREAGKVITILDNISNLINDYGGTISYRPVRGLGSVAGAGSVEDRWIVSRLESTIDDVTESLEDYRAFDAAAAIKAFVTEDFSRFYLKLAKKRMIEGTKQETKAILDVISYVFFKTLVVISPITPFVAESVYLDLYKEKESVFLEDWPVPDRSRIDTGLEGEMEIAKEAATALLSSRERAGISLRWPVGSETLEIKEDAAYAAVGRLANIIEAYTNAKHLGIKRAGGAHEEIRPLFAKLGPDFRERAGAVAEALREADAKELRRTVESSGHYALHTKSGTVDVRAEHFVIVQLQEEGDSVLFRYGKAHVEKEIGGDLKREALVREFERRVQLMRKELALKKADRITVGYSTVGELDGIIDGDSEGIRRRLNIAHMSKKLDGTGLVKEFKIEGADVKVSVKRVD